MKKYQNKDILIRSLYVDDLIITGNNQELVLDFKKKIMQDFEMTDLELLYYFLGMEVDESLDGIFICQKKYAEVLLKKYMLENCNTATTPLQVNEKLCKDDGHNKANEKTL